MTRSAHNRWMRGRYTLVDALRAGFEVVAVLRRRSRRHPLYHDEDQTLNQDRADIM